MNAFALVFPLTLVFVGCSPAGDPIARGSAHYRTQGCQSSYGGIGAEVDSGNGVGVPDVPISNTPSPNKGGLAVNGEISPSTGQPYKISCSVKGSSTLLVEAKLEGPNTSPGAADKGSLTRVGLDASIDAETGMGVGQVLFYTTDTLGAGPVTNTTCEIRATPAPPLQACSDQKCTDEFDAITGLPLNTPGETGRMWLEFSCPNVKVAGTGMEQAGCESNGTIVMERCTVR